MAQNPHWRYGLDLAATVAMIVAASAMVYVALRPPRLVTSGVPQTKTDTAPPAEPVALDLAALKGSASAQVVLIEFSDFQCPYCRRFATETWPAVDRDYVASGKVLVAFRHLPIEAIHRDALGAAAAAECAREQNAFWPYHDQLFRDPMPTGVDSLVKAGQSLGLDVGKFRSCLADSKTERIERSVVDAKKLGVTSTPTFFVGTRMPNGQVKVAKVIRGAEPLATFSQAIEALLGGR